MSGATILDANCVIGSIAVLEKRDFNLVLADMATIAQPGEFTLHDTGCPDTVWRRYLTERGWQRHGRVGKFEDLPAVPQTCLLIFPGHAAAFLCGCLFDRSPAPQWGTAVEEFWTRPKHGEPE
jgi:hypothetical protein